MFTSRAAKRIALGACVALAGCAALRSGEAPQAAYDGKLDLGSAPGARE